MHTVRYGKRKSKVLVSKKVCKNKNPEASCYLTSGYFFNLVGAARFELTASCTRTMPDFCVLYTGN